MQVCGWNRCQNRFGWENWSSWCWRTLQREHRTRLSNNHQHVWQKIWCNHFDYTGENVESSKITYWSQEPTVGFSRWLCVSFVGSISETLPEAAFGGWERTSILGTLSKVLRMVSISPVLQFCTFVGSHGATVIVRRWHPNISKQRVRVNVHSGMVVRSCNNKQVQIEILLDHSIFRTWGVCLHIHRSDVSCVRTDYSYGDSRTCSKRRLSMVEKRIQFYAVEPARRFEMGQPTLWELVRLP